MSERKSMVWREPTITAPTIITASTASYCPVIGKPMWVQVYNNLGNNVNVNVGVQFWDNDGGVGKEFVQSIHCPSGTKINLKNLLPFISTIAAPTAVGDQAIYINVPASLSVGGISTSWCVIE